jgi:SPP1 gp7 family putative phage head morphogenesis protein
MREALAFWADKVPMARADFDEMAEQMHARGFYVTGLNRIDQIEAVHTAIYHALSDGETFEDWKLRIKDIIDQQGWSGVRLDMIFRTNVQSAYMAGRYAQMTRPEILKARPYWRYSAINDGRTRPTHRAMNGRIFPADHPIWDTWFPPNGYRCRCGVDSVSGREVDRDGLTVETEDPTGKLFEPTDWRTGQKLPARLLMPDTGFMHNVGKEWTAGFAPEALSEKLTDLKLPRGFPGAICRETGGPVFTENRCLPKLSEMDIRHVLPVTAADVMEKGLAPETYVKAFLDEFGIKDIDGQSMHPLPCGLSVPVDKGFFIDKATGGWKATWTDKGPYMRLLARTIKAPYEIWQRPVTVQGDTRMALRLIRMFRTGKAIVGYVSWSLIGGRWWSATAFMPKSGRSEKAMYRYLEAQRGGVLLYREEELK